MTAEITQLKDLTVRGESIERVYGNYRARRYLVNRRYQRKLVWTLDEKRSFVDSVANGYPVPIILLAENRASDKSQFEIIDGMQRMNSIMSFIENSYAIEGGYFDLNTMAETKALLDAGFLTQQAPVLDRTICVRIAAYTFPLSIYEFSNDTEVDEVFRRINSGGRKLSRQELRIAGSTGHFAQLIRQVAAKVRGDVSSADVLLLNEMNKISIGNRELGYGITVDDIFWIQQSILTKEQVRESRDEELIADIFGYVLLDPKPSSRSEFIDDYFGFGSDALQNQRFADVETGVQKHTAEVLVSDFQRVLDQLRLALALSGKKFGHLMLGAQPARTPRYFQTVFLAMWNLIVTKNKEVANLQQLVDLLDGLGNAITIAEGGRWGSQDRVTAINAATGMISPAFKDAEGYDPARVRWITQLENILIQSYTEQAAYDFKQGLLRLEKPQAFDEDSFEKILKTLVAIANLRKGVTGYVIVGIAEDEKTAIRVQSITGETPVKFENFFVTGIQHDSAVLGKDLDQLFQMITDKIRSSEISEPLRDFLARQVKLVRYYDKAILILESAAQAEPSHIQGRYFIRHGNQLVEVRSENYGELFRRFQSGM